MAVHSVMQEIFYHTFTILLSGYDRQYYFVIHTIGDTWYGEEIREQVEGQ